VSKLADICLHLDAGNALYTSLYFFTGLSAYIISTRILDVLCDY